jgi:hypothetical protein
LYQLKCLCEFSSFICRVRFTSGQLASPPPFPFPGAASPLTDIVTPPRHVTLPTHWVKTRSLPPLHLPTMLYLHHHCRLLSLDLPSQSTMPSKLHPPLSFRFTVVSRSSSLRTMTPTVMNKSTLFRFLNNLSACEFT